MVYPLQPCQYFQRQKPNHVRRQTFGTVQHLRMQITALCEFQSQMHTGTTGKQRCDQLYQPRMLLYPCRGVVVEVVAQIQHDSFFSFHQRSMHLIDLFDRVQGPFRAWFASDDFKGLFDCACGSRREKSKKEQERTVVSAGRHMNDHECTYQTNQPPTPFQKPHQTWSMFPMCLF